MPPVTSRNPFASARRALVCAVLAGCGRAPSGHAVEPESTRRRGEAIEVLAASPLRSRLVVEPARLEPVRRTLEAPAQAEADPSRIARIAPPLPGRVVQLFVRFGDTVTAGQALLTLDSPDLVTAQTDYLRARSALAQAERTLARQQDLVDHGIGARREVETAATDRDLARSELDRAALRLRLLGVDAAAVGRPLVVRSPIAGRVVEFGVAPGEFRNDPAQPMMTVADLSTVWVTADVQEKDIRRVQAGEEASAAFAAWPDARFRGAVLFVGDLLDPTTRTIKVRVALDNRDRRLRPGMFAAVTFTERAAPEVVVPTTAVVLLGDASYVFVEAAPWVFARRRVTPGAQLADRTAIADGLRAGERVVTRNAVLLQ
ncbi:MAG: efflux RND transporter periplasmic adaptor subunit [Polyangiales bacterium]